MELNHYPIKIGRWFKTTIKKWVMLSNYVLCPENLIPHSDAFRPLHSTPQSLNLAQLIATSHCRTNTDNIMSHNATIKSDLC